MCNLRFELNLGVETGEGRKQGSEVMVEGGFRGNGRRWGSEVIAGKGRVGGNGRMRG